jgi:hypothetical protein
MRKTPRLVLTLAVLFCLVLDPLSYGQDPPAPSPASSLRTFFTVRSAQPDDTLPPELRKEFEKDDESPLRSVAIDLNGDGNAEKFYLCGVLAATGGPQWLVYDPARNAARPMNVEHTSLFFTSIRPQLSSCHISYRVPKCRSHQSSIISPRFCCGYVSGIISSNLFILYTS